MKKEFLHEALTEISKAPGLVSINLNIRSLPSKFEQIEILLESERIKILNLSESWLSNETTNNLIRIKNYKIYRLDRKKKKKGRRTMHIYA